MSWIQIGRTINFPPDLELEFIGYVKISYKTKTVPFHEKMFFHIHMRFYCFSVFRCDSFTVSLCI